MILLVSCSSPDTIKIGYIGPLTGDAASLGAPGVAAAETAIEEINDAGGVLGRRLELVVEDDRCSSDGVSAMNRLIRAENVIAISGPDCGSSAGPAIPLAQDAGIPTVIRWASVPHLPEIGPYIFRLYPSDAYQGDYAAQYIYDLGARSVAVLYVKNDYGKGLRDVFVQRFEELGGEIVLDESHEQTAASMKTTLVKLQQARPDLVYLASYRSDGRVILREMRELGLDLPVVAGDAFDADEIILADEAEGILFSTAVMTSSEEFKQKVYRATGVAAGKPTAPLAYDSIYVIAEAISRAGTLDRAAIRDEIQKTSRPGTAFPLIEFNDVGDFKYPAYEMKVIEGKRARAISS